MQEYLKKRVKIFATEILDNGKTIREIAKKYGCSKSTVHKDLHDRLQFIDKNMYVTVNQVLQMHAITKHIKGGLQTKLKYKMK